PRLSRGVAKASDSEFMAAHSIASSIFVKANTLTFMFALAKAPQWKASRRENREASTHLSARPHAQARQLVLHQVAQGGIADREEVEHAQRQQGGQPCQQARFGLATYRFGRGRIEHQLRMNHEIGEGVGVVWHGLGKGE